MGVLGGLRHNWGNGLVAVSAIEPMSHMKWVEKWLYFLHIFINSNYKRSLQFLKV